MSQGVVTQFARDSDTGVNFPTQWWDDGSGILQQITKSSLELPSGVTPVTGSFTAPTNSASFSPIPGRGFNATVSGAFSGAIQLNRSFDEGTTWIPVDTNFLQAVSKIFAEPEAGVLYQFQCTAMTGTANYRLSQ